MALGYDVAHLESTVRWTPNDTGAGPPGAVSGSLLVNNKLLGGTPTAYRFQFGYEE
jgi:hypothetical protein